MSKPDPKSEWEAAYSEIKENHPDWSIERIENLLDEMTADYLYD